MEKRYDALIVGGGPAGLAAALTLGRARKSVLLCDSGPRRNAAATHIHNFVTRDGTPPDEFRRIAREQLTPYTSVEVQDTRVEAIEGELGRFRVELATGMIEARRILLCVGMIDELPDIPGYRELWGKAIFQCPYCHGWEVRDRRFGSFVSSLPLLEWALFLQGWSRDMVVFTNGLFEVPAETRDRLAAAGARLEERKVRRLVPRGEELESVELTDGEHISRDVIFAHPPQRHTAIVASLGLDLDPQGFVRLNDQLETSRPGIHAAGDITTPRQAAIAAATSAMLAAHMLNHALMTDPLLP